MKQCPQVNKQFVAKKLLLPKKPKQLVIHSCMWRIFTEDEHRPFTVIFKQTDFEVIFTNFLWLLKILQNSPKRWFADLEKKKANQSPSVSGLFKSIGWKHHIFTVPKKYPDTKWLSANRRRRIRWKNNVNVSVSMLLVRNQQDTVQFVSWLSGPCWFFSSVICLCY